MIAAISVSGPAYRLGAELFPSVANKLRERADEISMLLGYAAEPPAEGPGSPTDLRGQRRPE